MVKRFLLLGLVVGLTACSAPAVLNFTPTHVVPAQQSEKINAEIRSINISVATKEEQRGDLQVGFSGNEYEQSFRTTFKEGLEEALARSAIFNDESPNKLSLSAKVLKFDSPGNNTQSLTYMTVRYEFLNRKTGQTAYVVEINSVGSVPLSYAFPGVVRFTEGRNRAVKANIEKFLENLKRNQFIQ